MTRAQYPGNGNGDPKLITKVNTRGSGMNTKPTSVNTGNHHHYNTAQSKPQPRTLGAQRIEPVKQDMLQLTQQAYVQQQESRAKEAERRRFWGAVRQGSIPTIVNWGLLAMFFMGSGVFIYALIAFLHTFAVGIERFGVVGSLPIAGNKFVQNLPNQQNVLIGLIGIMCVVGVKWPFSSFKDGFRPISVVNHIEIAHTALLIWAVLFIVLVKGTDIITTGLFDRIVSAIVHNSNEWWRSALSTRSQDAQTHAALSALKNYSSIYLDKHVLALGVKDLLNVSIWVSYLYFVFAAMWKRN